MKLEDIIKQSIDMHVHIGPDLIPRKYTLQSLLIEEKGKIGGFVLKNHFYPTAPFIQEIKQSSEIKLYGGVVLNNTIGGLNPEAIYASSMLVDSPIVVWFPTIHARNFLMKSQYEIAPEWVNNKNFIARKSKEVCSIDVVVNNKLTVDAIAVLKAIKKCKAVLATGHISWQEAVIVANKALELGITKIILTHPIYQKIAMPIAIQQQLAQEGCFIEIPYSMFSIDSISLEQIIAQISTIHPKNIILSSDVGQPFSASPSQSLSSFVAKLIKRGVSMDAIFTMLVDNPQRLLN
jgi:hypothetical protein